MNEVVEGVILIGWTIFWGVLWVMGIIPLADRLKIYNRGWKTHFYAWGTAIIYAITAVWSVIELSKIIV